MTENFILDSIKDLVHECRIIDSNIVQFEDDVRAACKANYCGMYNKSWTCPPAVGEIKDLKPKCLKYKKAIVFTTYGHVEDSFDFEGMLAIRDRHDEIQQQVLNRLNLPEDSYIILGAGGCRKCKKCAYPAPCRFPHKLIYSMESYGINVVTLASTIGVHYNNGENTITYFSIIFSDI